MRSSRVCVVLLALLAVTASGCGPRYARVTLRDHSDVKVQLRSQKQGREMLDRGFAHPATISGVRIANILSRIDVRLDGDREMVRKPAMPTELLYELGDAISDALKQADSSQEIVVWAIRRERRLTIFTQEYLTSFVVYVQGDDLYVHLSRVDYGIPKNGTQGVPDPWPGLEVMRFKVVPGDGIVPVGDQVISASWRSPAFRSASHLRLGTGGSLKRRQILMESPAEPPEPAPPEATGELAPSTLRALADLEESRRSGAISEAEYEARRSSILAADPAADDAP